MEDSTWYHFYLFVFIFYLPQAICFCSTIFIATLFIWFWGWSFLYSIWRFRPIKRAAAYRVAGLLLLAGVMITFAGMIHLSIYWYAQFHEMHLNNKHNRYVFLQSHAQGFDFFQMSWIAKLSIKSSPYQQLSPHFA